MSIAEFALSMLFAYGFAFGLQYRAIPWIVRVIGEPVGEPRLLERWLRGLGSCSYCTGFWGGVAWTAAPWLPRCIVFGMAAAGFCFAIDRWTE